MNILAVDDEQVALDNLTITLKEIPEFRSVDGFRSPAKALEWLSENRVNIAFLDINMKQMDGMTLAKKIKEMQPDCFIVFVTGYSQYALKAIQMHASGYLIKPVDVVEIQKELEYIMSSRRNPIVKKKIRVQCFGNFEVFIDDKPMYLVYSKTKEMFAYLIDRRGASVSIGELCAVLWEDRPESFSLKSHLRNIISDLSRQLSLSGASDILVKRRGSYAVATDKLDCDYYRFLQQEITAVNNYAGEYMTQYSWAEMTLGYLENNK